MTEDPRAVVARYIEAFNERDWEGMLATLDPDVEHHINEGGIKRGRGPFAEFLRHMEVCYREQLEEVVILSGAPDHPERVVAEFTVRGRYMVTDGGLPEARGQRYVLPGLASFSVRRGAITRVAVHYNLAAWVRAVS